MRHRPLRIPYWPVLGALALLLSSCGGGKKVEVVLPPALDRNSFREETGVNLPKEAEILSSTTSTDPAGSIYTTLMLKMPKEAEWLFKSPPSEVEWRTTSHQITVNELARLGVRLKDPKAPMRLRLTTSKTRGDGVVTVVPDGDVIFVECSFRVPPKK
jgi:hypothetical protein